MTFMRSSADTKRNPHPSRRLSMRGMVSFVLLVVVVSGCKTPDFIGSRYSNFTAYYNTFYNAERQFESGFKNLERFDQAVEREQYLPLFVKTTGMSASREFEQTVLKSANLLREHPESKWVDDALMLIGKSYFYQENYVGAIQKFTEIIALDTKLADEARFWLARCYITSGSFEAALEELTLAMAIEDADEKWVAQDRLLLAELAIQQEQWETAADHLAAGVDVVKDKELAARASFLHGQVLETSARYPEAVEAYRQVRDFTAPYELDYAARFSAARVDGNYVDPQRALREVRKLERDDKNVSKLGELRYLRARILQDAGGTDEALAIYDELLYDPLALPPGASIGSLRGKIHYALAELYRDQRGDYVMASAYFDSAATSLSSGGGRSSTRAATANSGLRAPEAIADAQDMKTSFARFARVWEDVALYDSLLWLGTMPQEAYDEKIMELRRQRAEELAEQRRILEERQREAAFRNASGQNDPMLNRGLPVGKVIPTPDDPTGSAGGYLFHEDPIRVQEGRMAFRNIWGTRPLVPNWRRSAALDAAQAQMSEEELAEQEAMLEEVDEDVLPEIDDSAVPRDSTSQAAMRSDRAASRYELGNVLFLGMALPDSAAVWYRQVIEEDAEEEVAPRAQYALAEVQRALGDTLSAERLYRDLLSQYPQSDFIPNVRERLGLQPIDVVAAEPASMAVKAFERAILFRNEDPVAAKDTLFTLAAQWRGFPESPKAVFAAGQIHLEQAAADSAAIFSPVRFNVPSKTMNKLWPDIFPIEEPVATDSLAADLASIDVMTVDAVIPDSIAADSTSIASMDFDPAEADSSALDSSAVDTEETELVAADSAAVDSTVVDSAAPDSLSIPLSETSVADAETGSVLSDSTAVDPLLAEETGGMDGLMPAPVVPERLLRIEDLLDYVVAEAGTGPLADRASILIAALEELKTPPPAPVDSTLLAADSLGVVSDSLMAVVADSLEMSPEGVQVAGAVADAGDMAAEAEAAVQSAGGEKTLEGAALNTDNGNGIAMEPPAEALPDSVVLAMVEKARRETEERRAAQQAARQVPTPGNPSGEGESDEGAARISWDLRPMMPNGQVDPEAIGFTYVLGSFANLPAAQAQYRQMQTRLDTTGVPVYILTNTGEERSQYLVSWGLFTDPLQRDENEMKWRAILPEPRNLLHLLPAE